MIISRTPTRLSLLGGGTDYPDFIKEYGGCVIGAAIDKYSYITARDMPPFFDYKTRLSYSKIECVNSHEEIEHRAIKATLKFLGVEDGVEISHYSDLPSKTGTGSSSSFIVGLLNALTILQGNYLEPELLRRGATHVEQNMMQETVGGQDQTFAAFGGINRVMFHKSGNVDVYPLLLNGEAIKELRSHLILFYVGGREGTAHDVAKTYVTDKRKEQFAMLRLANDGAAAIERREWDKLGNLLDMGWRVKRGLSASVSNPKIDSLYLKGRLGGAWGGKLMGAGGGGCLLFCAPPDKHEDIRELMEDALEIDFNFDYDGSKIIYCKR